MVNVNKQRLLIYFFYDNDGVVDGYINYIMGSLKPFVSEILVVCNGLLSNEGRKVFEQYSDNIIERENKGFDVWAYKAALDYYNKDGLAKFDEIILMNFTIMGPVFPLSEMFDTMDKKNVDFWGLTLFHYAPFDPFGTIKYGYIPTHIQSSFMVFRPSLFNSEDFHEYWQNLYLFKSYEEAVGMHEVAFTKTFEDKGYSWDVYIDTRDILNYTFYPLLHSPVRLLKEKRCPVFKRRSFFHHYNDFLEFNNGDSSAVLLEYIKNNTNYDVEMIWDNILRTCHHNDIYTCLHLNYVLSKEHSIPSNDNKCKSAVFVQIHDNELIKYMQKYLHMIPKEVDIHIIIDKSMQLQINDFYGNLPNNIAVHIANIGYGINTFLSLKGIVNQYDLICFIHNNYIQDSYLKINNEAFLYKCYENLIGSADFINNITNEFYENPRMGLLFAPNPSFGEHYKLTSEDKWGGNYENIVAFLSLLGVKSPLDKNKNVITSFSSMCWFRPKAFKPLLDYCEENSIDNLSDKIVNSVYLSYPFIAQSCGYYSGRVMSDYFAKIEINNLNYMLENTNKSLSSQIPFTTYNAVISELSKVRENKFENNGFKSYIKNGLRKYIKPILPKSFYTIYLKAKNKI